MKGDVKIEGTYDGALYHFVSQANRETFEKDPSRYAPAYGGYCGYAASIDKVSPVNVHIFQIVPIDGTDGGRLVLQHTPEAYALFNQDLEGSLKRADENWPGLVHCHGK